MLKVADALEANADKLGRLESANAGKPVGAAIDEIGVCADLFRFFAGASRVMDGLAANEFAAGHTSIIRRDPIGVVASIAPWNYPLYMASWKLGPALATGNTVVLKPSARTPLSALAFAEILSEIFPAGVVNVLSGSGADIGDALVSHPTVRMVSITGDTATGKHIAKLAADTVKRLHLELGGKAPVIVFDDADVDQAAETLRFAGYWNSGQDCTAATRVIAGPKVYDKFVSALADQVRTIKWGDPAEGDDIEMGSLIAQAHADKVEGMVDRARAGAEVVVGGTPAGSRRGVLQPDRHRRPGPEVGDRPGGSVRAGRHRPALQRRGAGRPVGERHALRPGVLDLHLRHRPGDARRQGARVRSRVGQRALHPDVRDAARRRQAVRLGQGRLEVRARGLHVRQARDDQHRQLSAHGEVAAEFARLDRDDLTAGTLVRRPRPDDRLDRAAGRLRPGRARAPHVLAVAGVRLDDGSERRYSFALTGRPLRVAVGRATERGERWRRRWPRAGRSPRFGRTRIPGPRRRPRWSAGRRARWSTGHGRSGERDLGADQSNTSVVLGEAVLLKAFRRLQPGLNPELELGAYLSEEAGFAAVAPLAGFAELVSARHGTETVAVAQAFIADGEDAYESIAEALTAWILAPGRGQRRVRDGGGRGPRDADGRACTGRWRARAAYRTWSRGTPRGRS